GTRARASSARRPRGARAGPPLSGFLLKDSPPDQLIAAINVVASGDALLAPSITRRLVEEFVHRPTPRERPPELPSDSERIPATASDVARAAVVIVGSKEYRP
ncbi:MAG TPA: hypothetical protein VE078_07790, partial [Thermoanaerobaculia bacterium]|nr:hypothetical protein [Thermoanaerobaculia bacterium]